MKSCNDCKRWKECIGKEHFKFPEIRWCPYQVLWILENCEILLSGEWPVNSSGYTDSNVITSPSKEAYFVKPELVIGEVEKRLKTTGEAGEALKDAANRGYPLIELSPPAYRALMYVKGFRRKRQSYSQWKRGILIIKMNG